MTLDHGARGANNGVLLSIQGTAPMLLNRGGRSQANFEFKARMPHAPVRLNSCRSKILYFLFVLQEESTFPTISVPTPVSLDIN
jgi:hypothetical protein